MNLKLRLRLIDCPSRTKMLCSACLLRRLGARGAVVIIEAEDIDHGVDDGGSSEHTHARSRTQERESAREREREREKESERRDIHD